MSLVARDTKASLDASTGMFALQVTGLIAGEDLDAVAACHIQSSDGKVYMSNGGAANESAEFVGFTPRAVKAGQPVTLFSMGARFRYSAAGLTPGNLYYMAETDGRLDTAATTAGIMPIARAVTANDIMCIAAHEFVNTVEGAG